MVLVLLVLCSAIVVAVLGFVIVFVLEGR